MKNTLTKIITAVLSASTLALSASAYTIPEYSFDYSVYHSNCSSCDFCSDTLIVDNDIDDSLIAPNAILLVLKCEYSYFNSVWTIEDFPELNEIGVEISEIYNMENRYNYTDEEIQERLDEIMELSGTYHTGLAVKIAEEDQTVENARKVLDAIAKACENGKHPEIFSVEFNIIYQNCEYTGLFADADINGDSEINSVDATMIVRHTLGVSELDSVQQEWADVNQDGTVNSIDATMVIRYALGVIDKYGNVIE